MVSNDVKNELVKRYKYFYENAPFILGLYYNNFTLNTPTDVIRDLEISLLSDTKLEDTDFYKEFEEKKEDKNYLEIARNAIEQQKKDSWGYSFPPDLGLWNLLLTVRRYVENQSGDIYNKRIKLDVLDEYFRLRRYENNSNVWTSGYEYNMEDIKNNLFNFSCGIKKITPTRQNSDVGVRKNVFLETIYSREDKKNIQYFSEEEKQDIYLSLNDELPWNLSVNCSFEEHEEDKLERPNNTKPCEYDFNVKESKIFKLNDEYYQRCSNCGYIVDIPKEIFSPGIMSRIDRRVEKDEDLFRKNILKSELKGIENKGKVLEKSPKN